MYILHLKCIIDIVTVISDTYKQIYINTHTLKILKDLFNQKNGGFINIPER